MQETQGVMQSQVLPCRAHRELGALDRRSAALVDDGSISEHAEGKPGLQGTAGDAAAGHDPAAGVPVMGRDCQCRLPLHLCRARLPVRFYQ